MKAHSGWMHSIKARGTGIAQLAVLGAAMLWGGTGTLQALLPSERDPIAVAWFRVAIGAACLGLWWGMFSRQTRIAGRASVPGLSMAAMGMAGYNLFFFSGVSLIGVGTGTAIALGSAPVWVGLYETLVMRAKLDRQRLMGQGLCIAGAVILVAAVPPVSGLWAGVGLSLLSGASYAFYSVVTNRMPGETGAVPIAFLTFAGAAVLLVPAAGFADFAWVGWAAVWPLFCLGALSTALAYFLFTFGVRRIAPARAVTLSLAEPLTAWLLAVFVLHEPAGLIKTGGALLLGLGLVVVVRTREKPFAPRSGGGSGGGAAR